MSDFPCVWFWHPRMGEKNRKGLRCRVLVHGGRNSVLVELEDGEKVVTSRYAVRQMPQHYTKNTVSAEAWCGKCEKRTQHRIDDRRLGPCLECLRRLDEEHEARSDSPAEQMGLFGKW